jgi:hypothetical protein
MHAPAAPGDGLVGKADDGEGWDAGADLICTSTARASIPSKATVVIRTNIAEPSPEASPL